jgi:TorA maturation chaperone TorD
MTNRREDIVPLACFNELMQMPEKTHNTENDACIQAAEVYRFLAHYFMHEPTAAELAELAHAQQGPSPKSLGYDLLADLAKRSAQEQSELLAIDYCRLFIGPGPHLSPHESVVRGGQQHWSGI